MGFSESEELVGHIQQLIKQEFNKPDNYMSLFIPAKIGKVNGNYCDAYLNGSFELTTNIPINPSISVGEDDEVWVIKTNFKNTDLFVLCKRVLEGYEHDYDKILQEVKTQIDETMYQINAVRNITNELSGKLDSKEAEFKITADEISSKVTRTEIEGIQTSNLLYNSEFNIGVQNVDETVTPPVITYDDTFLDSWTFESPWCRDTTKLETSSSLYFTTTGQSFDVPLSVSYNQLFSVAEGFEYVGSIYSMTTAYEDMSDTIWLELEWLTSEGTKIDSSITKVSIVPNKNNEWQRFSVVKVVPNGAVSLRFKICSQTNGVIYIARPMLQKGNVLTAWNPSRQDTNKPLNERLTIAESSITQTADQIQSKVSTTTYEDGIASVSNLAYEGNVYVRGTGFNRPANRILKIGTQTIYDTTGRGLRLTVLKRSDMSIVSDTNYDVYGDVNARVNLTNALNNLNDANIVILSSWDAIITDTALEDAMKRCGGTGKKFVSSPTTDVPVANHRTPYVLIGIPSIGAGGGLEVFTSDANYAPYAELTTKIINGTPQGMDSIKGNTYSRLTVAESSITQQANSISLKVDTTTFNTTISGITSQLNDIASDNKLTANEKIEVKKEWDIIFIEKPILVTQATTYGLTTTDTKPYTDAYDALNTYLSPLLLDTTTTSDITGSTLRSNFTTYFKEKQNLENKISAKINQLASDANTLAGTANSTANTAIGKVNAMADDSKLTTFEKQQLRLIWDGIKQEKPLLVAQATAFENASVPPTTFTEKQPYITAYDTLFTQIDTILLDANLAVESTIDGALLRTNFTNYYKNRMALANKLADVANTTANSAKGVADGVQLAVNDMVNDNKLTPDEKQQLKIQWDAIYSEKPILSLQGTTYNVTTELTNYNQAYQDLATILNNNVTYVSGLPSLFSNLTTTSDVIGANIRTKFEAYFTTKLKLTKIIVDITKGIADNAKKDIGDFKADIIADNKLSPVEKVALKNELNSLGSEKTQLETIASSTSFGITTEKTDYTNAYIDLNTYLNTYLADLTTTSDIDSTLFLTKYNTFYTKRMILLNKLADVANNTAITANLSITGLKQELADDNKLTPVEKQAVKREMDAIVQEYALLVPNQTNKYSINATPYTNAYNALSSLLATPLSSGNMGVTSDIDGTDFRNKFVEYYKQKQNLINLLDDASVGAIAVQDSIKKNPIFDAWSGTLPDGYSLYQTLNPTKETTLYRTGKNAVRFNVTTSTVEAGLTSTDFQSNLANYKYVAVEIGFMLTSGTLSGTGLLFDWKGLSPYRSTLRLKDEVPTPELNKWYTVKKVLKRPTDTIATFTGYQIYLMANYSGDSLGALTSKNIIFDKILAREATKEEIDVFETLPKKVDSDQVINAINSIDVTTTGIKIQGSKIDIAGQVTYTTLDPTMKTNIDTYNGWKQSGTTKINGGVIETDTILIGSLEPTLEQKVLNGDSALGIANSQKTRLDNMSNDNIITPEEKIQLAKEWDAIFDEKPKIVTQANLFTTITTEKTDYINAYDNLNTYLNPYLSSPSTTDTITGGGILLRDNFSWYNTAKVTLLNKIAEVTKGVADTASTNATTAIGKVNDIADDNKLTPVEKQSIRLEWDTITANKAVLDSQATTYSITTEKTSLNTAYTNLGTMLNNNVTWTSGIPSLITDANLSVTSTITGTTFRSTFQAYYTAEATLVNKISTTAQTTAETNAKNAVATGLVTLPANKLSGQFTIDTSNSIKNSASNFTWDSNGLIAIDPYNSNNRVKLSSAGLGVSTNGGVSYNNAITGSGISATYINAGILDCSRLTVTNLTVTESMISGYISASKISGGVLNGISLQTTFDSYYGRMFLSYGDLSFQNGSGTTCGYLKWNGSYMDLWGSGLQINSNYSYSNSYNTGYLNIGSMNVTSSSALYLGCGSSNVVVAHYQGNTSSYAPIWASAFTIKPSSLEHKTNIEDFSECAIDMVMSSGVKTYDLIADVEQGIERQKNVGLIVEESPHCILCDDGGGINLYPMVSVLWKAVQEQQEIIEKLEKDIDNLKWLK